MKVAGYALTDIGQKRKVNEDAYFKDDALQLYIVADGMGGHRGGEVASRLAVEVISKSCRSQSGMGAREKLERAINLSCKEIFQQSKNNVELQGMGTTIVALLIEQGVGYIAQVGDSRAYLMNEGAVWQVTEDHSLVNEEIRAGRLIAGQESTYQFRNVITRSVGYEDHVQVDVYRRELQAGDRFFLCTDGLSGLVSVEEIRDEVSKNGPETALRQLVALANARGGDDNITALVILVD